MFVRRLCIALSGLAVLVTPRPSAATPLTAQGPEAPAVQAPPVQSPAWGGRLEGSPPGYARSFPDVFDSTRGPRWLLVGAELGLRFELRRDVRRPTLDDDELLVSRTRLYLGAGEGPGPLRFGVELQDARQFGSDFPDRPRDVNRLDVQQAWVGLRFERLFDADVPVEIKAGRLSEDYVDRRQVGRNRWRNTVNAFDGVQVTAGGGAGGWQGRLLAFRPVVVDMTELDSSTDEALLVGALGRWQGHSRDLVVQPYLWTLGSDAVGSAPSSSVRSIGVHAFGISAGGAWDYDVDIAGQFGDEAGRRHRAWALAAEIAHRPGWRWNPRISVTLLAASGDEDAGDDRSGRFNRLFQATHPYSTTDLFSWQNLISPKARLDLRAPGPRWIVSWGGYWLESPRDAWVIPGLHDPTGQSGTFIGHELEVEATLRFNSHLELRGGSSWLWYGEFARANGRDGVGVSLWLASVLQL